MCNFTRAGYQILARRNIHQLKKILNVGKRSQMICLYKFVHVYLKKIVITPQKAQNIISKYRKKTDLRM